jgi:hypothetical protein
MNLLRRWQFGAYLALLGVLLQVALGLGHVGAGGIDHREGLLLNAVANLAPTLIKAQATPGEERHPAAGDLCTLCWHQGAAGSATLPALAQTLATVLLSEVGWPATARDFHAPPLSPAYAIRAPPLL